MRLLQALRNMTPITRSRKAAGIWISQVAGLIAKEFQQIARDPSAWMVAGFLPFVFLLLFGYGISLDPGKLKLALIDVGWGKNAQSLASTFARSPWFETVSPNGFEEGERLMRDSEVQGLLLFRGDFENRLAAGETGDIEILIDGSEPNTARFIQIYSKGLIGQWLANRSPGGQTQNAPLALENRFWFNAEAKSEYFLVPGSITVIMTLIGTLLTSLVFAREYERGTMEVLLTTPISRLQILLGKLIPYYLLGMLSMAFCVGFALLIFEVPFRGSFLTLAFLSTIFLLAALGQGLCISIILKKQLVAAEAGLYSGLLPAMLLSGFVFDIASMPYPMQLVTKILPATYFNVCIRTIFLAGDVWPVFWPRIAPMLTLAFLFLSIVYYKLGQRLG